MKEERDDVRALVAEHVHVRFVLDAGAFADRVLEQTRTEAAGQRPREYVRRLSLDDLYLATACSLGDSQAWDELAERHVGFMRDFALRFLPEPEAQDVVGQVVADLWQRRKIGRYQGRSTLRTWLGAVVAHAALNAVKARRPAAPLDDVERRDDQGGSPSADPAATQARSLLAGLVAEALGGLPAEAKVLLRLYYEQGLTLDQMAVALHSSKTALSRRLSRIRSELRAAVESFSLRTAGASADALRAGVDLGHLDLDLGALLAPDSVRSEDGARLSKSRDDPPSRRLPG